MNFLTTTVRTTLLVTTLAASISAAFGADEAQPVQGAAGQQPASSGASGGAATAPETTSDSAGASGSAGQDTGGETTSGTPAAGYGASGAGSTDVPSGAATASDTAGASGSTGKGAAAGTPPIFMIVPVEVAGITAKGCWARIHDRENYMGDTLTLVGPNAFMDLSGPFGLDWDDRVNSIEVGPHATVEVFDNPGWVDPVTTFKPGQRVPDLSTRLGFFDEFASIRITCVNT